jgi:radical SAM superfamily enzyme
MHFMIEQCEKNDIVMCWGMIVGYPGETEDDFQETLDFFSRYSYLNEKNMVNGVDLGPTLMIVRGTPLFEKAASLEIDNHSPIDWVHKKTGNTIKVRIDRWMRLREHCLKLGYKVNDSEINMLKEKLKQIKECE